MYHLLGNYNQTLQSNFYDFVSFYLFVSICPSFFFNALFTSGVAIRYKRNDECSNKVK